MLLLLTILSKGKSLGAAIDGLMRQPNLVLEGNGEPRPGSHSIKKARSPQGFGVHGFATQGKRGPGSNGLANGPEGPKGG
eukprot:6302460-Pyramimonas_sp.AAC.1